MSTAPTTLPISETHAPAEASEVAEIVRAAHDSGTPVYPIGGGASLDYGMTPRAPGWGLSVAGLHRVVDFPARDMTITVEAGIRMADLTRQLAAEGQQLPIDVPRAAEATLGGVIATNFNGPRRYGQGSIRDYVIGIAAVDGRGVSFRAGGKVVKNVAGYDFCKLLTGSCGTLAVITEVTLKVKPIHQAAALVACRLRGAERAETALADLVQSRTTPMAIELLAGTDWQTEPGFEPLAAPDDLRLVVGYEGTLPEVAWQVDQLAREWDAQGLKNFAGLSSVAAGEIAGSRVAHDPEALSGCWSRLVEYPAREGALWLKFAVRPSAAAAIIQELQAADASCSIAAHAGNGVVLARFPAFSASDAGKLLVQTLHPAALRADGHLTVWSAAGAEDLTRQAVWGGTRGEHAVMQQVKQAFDPAGILNPGRFWY